MKTKIASLMFLFASALFPQLVLAQWTPGNLGYFGLPDNTVLNIISGIMSWLLIILGIIGVIGFAVSGLLYLTAAGDEDQAKRAKRAMTYSIIGVIVGMLGLVILSAAVNLLNARRF